MEAMICSCSSGFTPMESRASRVPQSGQMLKRDGKVVCNYDRGWDVEPADENTQLALELLLHSENW